MYVVGYKVTCMFFVNKLSLFDVTITGIRIPATAYLFELLHVFLCPSQHFPFVNERIRIRQHDWAYNKSIKKRKKMMKSSSDRSASYF